MRTPTGSASVDPATPQASARKDHRRPARKAGRGAYVCVDPGCARRAVESGRLARALRLEGPLPSAVTADLMRAAVGQRGEEERDG